MSMQSQSKPTCAITSALKAEATVSQAPTVCRPSRQACSIAFGRSLPAPAGPQVVRGAERYTFDVAPEGMLHIKMLRSPHPHAKIISIDKRASLSVPGVHAVLTFEDAPDRLFSTARHEWDWMDPDDTRVLDNVVRFVGQKVAAVIAETEAAAEEGCRLARIANLGELDVRHDAGAPPQSRVEKDGRDAG